MKSKKVCRVVWFDSKGRFAKAPNKPESKSKPKNGKAKTYTKTLRVEGGGAAIIKQHGEIVSVKYIPDISLRQQAKNARRRGDTTYIRGYNEWIKSVQKQLAKDALAKQKLELDHKYTRAMESSQASDRGRKGAKERGKGRSEQAKLKTLSNNQLIALKPKGVYQTRAKRAELKARGLKN